jgi:hypothetical protein
MRLLSPLLIAIVFTAGCSTMDMKPIYSADGPSIVIASHDVSQVKTAILEQASTEHFKLDAGGEAGEYLEVSRRLSALKVLLLTETIAGKNDREVLRFHVETVDAGVRVYVYRIEQMEIPGGGLNEDPLMDKDHYAALQTLLVKVKRQVEGT